MSKIGIEMAKLTVYSFLRGSDNANTLMRTDFEPCPGTPEVTRSGAPCAIYHVLPVYAPGTLEVVFCVTDM